MRETEGRGGACRLLQPQTIKGGMCRNPIFGFFPSLSLSPMLQGGRNQFGEPSVAAAACFFKALRCKKQLGPLRRCWRRRRNRFRRRREGGGRTSSLADVAVPPFPKLLRWGSVSGKKGRGEESWPIYPHFFLEDATTADRSKKGGRWEEVRGIRTLDVTSNKIFINMCQNE